MISSRAAKALIGVPRFELGTSPTRTERATRLRHTPRGHRLAEVPMDDRGAEVFDIVQAAFGRDPARFLRPDPELEPERAGAGVHCLPRVLRRVLRAAEDVHEVDRL